MNHNKLPLQITKPWRDCESIIFTGLCFLATLVVLAILVVIVGYIAVNGWGHITWKFLTSPMTQDIFDASRTGVLSLAIGTAAKVILMTIAVVPVGAITAIYLSEYSSSKSIFTKVVRLAINNLAGVPAIVFGLFGVGFFIKTIGSTIDATFFSQSSGPVWGKPCLLWASFTLAVMTLPVVIVATEEALRSIPNSLREASYALGATKLETIFKVLLPISIPGLLTGSILAVSRAAGEVAPILFTGAAYYMAGLPKSLSDQFMDLGYQVYILATQSPNIEKTRALLFATSLVLLVLTLALNLVAILIRYRMRSQNKN